MKKGIRDLGLSFLMGIGAIALLTGFVMLMNYLAPVTAQASHSTSETVITAETSVVTEDPMFDTSILETWCHGEDLGTIRMVGGWVHEREGDVWTLHDEQGNAWTVEDLHNMQEHGWRLLGIADNNTTDDATDDVIVKLWTEVY